jgi:hypothetical protein
MAYMYKKHQQYGIGNLDRIALLLFAGAALASFQALQLNLSNFLILSIFLALVAAVGRAAISDAVAGRLHYKCNRTMVVTSNYFTR